MQLLRRRQGNVRPRAGLAAAPHSPNGRPGAGVRQRTDAVAAAALCSRMKSAHADVDRARGSRRPAFASRVFDLGYWILAIALLGVYCGLRSSGEIERRAAIAGFFDSDGASVPAELLLAEPADLQAPDAQR